MFIEIMLAVASTLFTLAMGQNRQEIQNGTLPASTTSPLTSPYLNALSMDTATFVQSLDHVQLQTFLQMMLTQQGHFGLPSMPNSPTPTVFVNPGPTNINGGNLGVNVQLNGYNTVANGGSGTPLMQLVLFRSEKGQKVAKMANQLANSQLGEYIGSIHSYWAKATPVAKDLYRTNILRNIDSLHVPIALKHGIQEMLPGLVGDFE